MKTTLPQKITLFFFGMLLSLVVLEIGLRLGGFIILSLQEGRNQQAIRQKGTCRILCIGESTTQGQYPKILEEELNQRDVGVAFSVIDKGIGGTTSSAILSRVELYLTQYHPDIVVGMMGINDKEFASDEDYHLGSWACFVRSLRIHKLGRLLWLNIKAKMKERGLRHSPICLLKPCFADEGYSVKEAAFKKALELNPKNDGAYVELGWLYQEQRNFRQAEAAFKKALELNPKNDGAYLGLGVLYKEKEDLVLAVAFFKKAFELNINNEVAHSELGLTSADLGQLYNQQGDFIQAERYFKKAIKLNPTNSPYYFELGRALYFQGKTIEAEEILQKTVELKIDDDAICSFLARLYKERGKNESANIYYARAKELREIMRLSQVSRSYLKIKEILDKRQIRLVCVQYPMRSLTSLKKIFEEDNKGVIFVDNERIFKEVVAREGYKTYFRDNFSGDFGHCTPKGNRLLARNIASVILKEIFNK